MPGMGGLHLTLQPAYKEFMVRAIVVEQTKEERRRGLPFFRRTERFDKITFKPDRDMLEAIRQSFGGIWVVGWLGTKQHVFLEMYTLIFLEAEGMSTEFAVGTDVIITFGYEDGRDSHMKPDQAVTIEKVEKVSSVTAFR